MSKMIDVSQQLLDFTGKVIEDGTQPLTLKNVVLVFLNNAQHMNLSRDDMVKLYTVGVKFGTAKDNVELDQAEYDALKRMLDDGQVIKDNKPILLFGIVITQQVRDMVNAAKNVE